MKVDQEYDVALIHTLFGKKPICHISSNVETTSTAIYMILSFKEAGYNVELSGRGHYLITKNGKGFTASLVFDRNSGRHNLKVELVTRYKNFIDYLK